MNRRRFCRSEDTSSHWTDSSRPRQRPPNSANNSKVIRRSCTLSKRAGSSFLPCLAARASYGDLLDDSMRTVAPLNRGQNSYGTLMPWTVCTVKGHMTISILLRRRSIAPTTSSKPTGRDAPTLRAPGSAPSAPGGSPHGSSDEARRNSSKGSCSEAEDISIRSHGPSPTLTRLPIARADPERAAQCAHLQRPAGVVGFRTASQLAIIWETFWTTLWGIIH